MSKDKVNENMSTSQALALAPSHSNGAGLTAHSLLSNPSLFQTYQTLAQITAASQLSYGKATTPEQIAVKQRDIFLVMLKGLEIGMLPMQALDSIDVIAGKPALKPQGMLAQIKARKLLEWMKIDDDGTTCTVTMKRKDEDEPYVESFGMEDADKMMTTEWENNQKRTIPLSQKANWKAQAKTMRKWRAVAACCRIGFPDVIQGMYTPEELGADVMVSEDGEMVIVDPIPAPTTTPPASSKIISGAGLGQRGGPLGRDTQPATPPPAPEEPPTIEAGEGDSEPHWSESDDKRQKIVDVIKAQTGDSSLTWELVKTLVPGDVKSYDGQGYAKLAIAGWQAQQKPAAAKNETKLGKKQEETAAAPTQPAKGEVIVDAVRYLGTGNTKYLEFAKGNLFIRRYSRSGTFKKEVGDDYYTENDFENMVIMTRGDEPYSINPLQIFYETKVSDDGKTSYNLATKCVPVTDATALDQYFGSIPFTEEGA